MERKLYETIVKEKDKAAISGNKVRFTTSTLLYLSKQMRENGASLNDRMIFEREFLEANGIVVPESFFNATCPVAEDRMQAYRELTKFYRVGTAFSEKNICGSVFYNGYLIYCQKNDLKPLSKKECYEYLRAEGILVNSGTIGRVTMRNVILNRTLD